MKNLKRKLASVLILLFGLIMFNAQAFKSDSDFKNSKLFENENNNSNEREIFDHQYMFQFGTTLFHPGLKNFADKADGDGRYYIVLLRTTNFFTESRRWSITGTFAYQKSKSEDMGGYGFDATSTSIVGIVRTDIHWVRTKSTSFYSGLGIGYRSADVEPDEFFDHYELLADSGITFQLNIVGFQAELSNNFGVFSELGFGDEGVFQVGLQYCL